MRRILFIIWFITLLPLCKGRTVDSIVIEQAGDMIKVHYKLLNSTPDQIFRISVLCSINGGFYASISFSLDKTKRILNANSFQMHLIGGLINRDLYYYWPGPHSPVLWREGEDGAEAGCLLTSKRIPGSDNRYLIDNE